MNKLILDFARWRSGNEGKYKVGEGNTKLLNKQGYSCCLGLFSAQLCEEKILPEDILDKFTPAQLGKEIPLLTTTIGSNSRLAYKAMQINDNRRYKIETRIGKLQELFAKEGYVIEVVNKP